MNKSSPLHIVVAAALFGIGTENSWSEGAATEAPAAPAEQAAAQETAADPGYAPTPYQGGYEPYWQPPPRPAPPPGYYGHYPRYYPPYPQYRAAPAAPAENPLSAELKQTQQQLADLQAEQQAIREVMQQAQSEYAKAGEQLSIVIEEMDILYEVLSKLKARLDIQSTSLQGAVEAGTADSEIPGSVVAGETAPADPPAAASAQPETGGGPIEGGENEAAQPEAR